MNMVWIGASLLLAVSLMLPRRALHVAGLIGCTLLLIHAVQIADAVFIASQVIFITANIVGLVHYGRLTTKTQRAQRSERQ